MPELAYPPSPRVRRAAAELALMAAMGLFMGAIGPYGTALAPAFLRYPYWLICMIGGGCIGTGIDLTLGRRFSRLWTRVLATSLAMTPPVTLLVLATGAWLLDQPAGLRAYLVLLWQVFVICLPVMAVRALAWRAPLILPQATIIETRTVIEPPLPAAEAVFRRRLSARRRTARLIAVEADDHYLRVHTDAGSELLTLRFADALADLAAAHGYQVHRSWWIAADAIQAVRWRRGTGEAQLAGDLTAPISRTHAPVLRAAGWM
jgi:hypothetical protein